jgi:hypothetical protein
MKLVVTTLNSTYEFEPASRTVSRNGSVLGEYGSVIVEPIGYGGPLVCRFNITQGSWAGIKEGPVRTSLVLSVTLA